MFVRMLVACPCWALAARKLKLLRAGALKPGQSGLEFFVCSLNQLHPATYLFGCRMKAVSFKDLSDFIVAFHMLQIVFNPVNKRTLLFSISSMGTPFIVFSRRLHTNDKVGMCCCQRRHGRVRNISAIYQRPFSGNWQGFACRRIDLLPARFPCRGISPDGRPHRTQVS